VEYTLGFLFTINNEVLLIRKTKPYWQKDRLNGVGGKVEKEEDPDRTMEREFEEEAGVPVKYWEKFLELQGTGYILHCYTTIGKVKDISKIESKTEERVNFYKVEDILNCKYQILNNLHFLIPMAKYHLTESKISGVLVHRSPTC